MSASLGLSPPEVDTARAAAVVLADVAGAATTCNIASRAAAGGEDPAPVPVDPASIAVGSEDAATAFKFPESFLCCGGAREAMQTQFGSPADPASAVVASAEAFFLARVPEGAIPGTKIRVQAPEGGSILDVVIPAGALPGSALSILRPFSGDATTADAMLRDGGPPAYDDPGEIETRAKKDAWAREERIRFKREPGDEPKRCCWPFNGVRTPTTASAPWRSSTRTR